MPKNESHGSNAIASGITPMCCFNGNPAARQGDNPTACGMRQSAPGHTHVLI